MRAVLSGDVSSGGLSHRDQHLLRAVADGRVTCTTSSEPDFYVDGVAYCDHIAARLLTHIGLIEAADHQNGTALRPVRLTRSGRNTLS